MLNWLRGKASEVIVIVINITQPCKRPTATHFILSTISINHTKIEGNIMAVQFGKAQYVTGILTPVAKDSQGNNVPSEIKAGSLVAYSVADPTIATIVPDPTNALGFRINGVADGLTTWTANGVADDGSTITITETITISDATPPPPTATGFTVAYSAPAAQ